MTSGLHTNGIHYYEFKSIDEKYIELRSNSGGLYTVKASASNKASLSYFLLVNNTAGRGMVSLPKSIYLKDSYLENNNHTYVPASEARTVFEVINTHLCPGIQSNVFTQDRSIVRAFVLLLLALLE